MKPAQFAKNMAGFAKEVRTIEQKVALAAGLAVKTSVAGTLRVAAPRGRVNVGKRGAKVGVRFAPRGTKSVRVYMTGPVQLIESDTKAHRIPKAGGRKKKYAVIPGVGPRAYANHPGTKGKHPWEKGLVAAAPALPKVTGKVYFDQFKKHIK